VRGDPTQLHQVLLNLCVNARDAMPEGGLLRLDTANQTVDEAFASMIPGATPGDYVGISVSDTGTGIAPAVMEHLFEPFFTTKGHGKGSGLGLSTVMGIVRSHGGFLQVKNEIGHGARFTFYIPAVSEPMAPGEHKAAEPAPRGHGELVLVVDDEEGIRQVTTAILERSGYRAMSEGDGAAGVARFAQCQEKIAVVLSDILMPYMDGVAMIRAIRRLKPGAACLVTTGALIGGGVEVKLEDLKRIGVRNVLVKPYTNEELLWSIHRALLSD
jgi:CheY-like chemotaxis protein